MDAGRARTPNLAPLMLDDAAWQQLIDGLRRGDALAARRFWDQYGDKLHQVANKHLHERVRRRIGPEDIAQSVCRTFLRRTTAGQFQLADSENLWRLLCAITLTKVREQTRFHLRQKRGLGQEVSMGGETASRSRRRVEHPSPAPTPDDAVAFADQFQQLLADLDDEERQIVQLRLEECTLEEIAEKLGCSERTVRRMMKRVQDRFQRMLDSL